MMPPQTAPDRPLTAQPPSQAAPARVPIVPLPSRAPSPARPIVQVIDDDRAMTMLIKQMIERSGVPLTEIAKRLGIKYQSIQEYTRGKRSRPSAQWLARLAAVIGAKVYVELP